MKPRPFKEEFTLEERAKESAAMIASYPDRIPVLFLLLCFDASSLLSIFTANSSCLLLPQHTEKHTHNTRLFPSPVPADCYGGM
ncbi:Os11g0100100 [Oryza sativa Japonica Group]|uniref:Os11g0100100 protein n=2 Tax=Oryza TaxID=4527 RepID=A0A0P0XYC2_ORYSJ|nr:hypothetical protein EE612_053027 [Oryza sativa]BAT12260.1 Os11g0100100 [Oryza sativa Japonica Group]